MIRTDHAYEISRISDDIYDHLADKLRPEDNDYGDDSFLGETLRKIQDHADALDADLKESEDRGERFFQALQRALPGHYQHVLWFHYSKNHPSLVEKFGKWAGSDKNTVKPYDPEYWFRKFGLHEGDWASRPSKESDGAS